MQVNLIRAVLLEVFGGKGKKVGWCVGRGVAEDGRSEKFAVALTGFCLIA